MKLLSMKLTNFKGIRDLMLDFPDGGNYSIYGTNGAGKTTIVDALTWLLFDKDSTDAKDFNIKTVVNGEPLHHAEHSVECAFLMETGLRVTLKKVYKEKWQKPRGKLQAEFAGHTTEYYIDNVGKSATAYKQYISGIVDEKTFKVLTNPLYFNEFLKDMERRDILMAIIGGVEQDVIIAENPEELKELKPFLQGRKVEDFKQIVKQSLSKTKKNIDSIEPAIKEHQAMMISGADAANTGMYETAVKRADDENANLIRQIAEVKAGAVDVEREQKKAEINKALWQARDEEAKTNRDAKAKLQKAADEAAAARLNAENVVYSWDHVIKELEQEINSYNRTREQLITTFNNTKNLKFKSEPIETTCPYCGQAIPEDKVEAARQKQEEAEKSFNLKRSEHLKQINADGKKNNELKEAAQQKLTKAIYDRAAAVTDLDVKKALEETAKRDLATLPTFISPIVEQLEKELAELEQQGNTPDESINRRVAELEELRLKAAAGRREAQAKLNDIEQNRKHQARIRELQDEEKNLAATFTALTKQQYLCDQYSRCLTEHIDRRIADKFKMARFVMFKDNITNDGAKECCEAQVNGVPYHDINKTTKLNIGLDIIQALSNFYLVSMPVFIDNAESYVELLQTNSQIIRLVVSADDKTLRVEKD